MSIRVHRVFPQHVLTLSRYYDYNEKMSRPYEHYYDPHWNDVRPQYSRIIPSTQPLQRPRRSWPPSPKAEDERLSLSREHEPQWSDTRTEEAQSRGTIDQQPIIEDVNPQPRRFKHDNEDQNDSGSESVKTRSSSESSGPRTPLDSRNQDQRYVYIPKEGIEIPLTYDEAREPKYAHANQAQEKLEKPRGRNDRPKVDTSFSNQSSEPLPPRERAPSPYAYAPKPKANESHSFGDHLLSPDAIPPSGGMPHTVLREPSQRPQAREPSRTQRHQRSSTGEGNKGYEHTQRVSHPAKPPVLHSASSDPRSGAAALAGGSERKSSYYHGSSDDSDDKRRRDSKPRALPTAGHLSPDSPRKPPTHAVDDLGRRLHTRSRGGLGPAAQPPRARSAVLPPLSASPAEIVAAHALLSSPPYTRRQASPRASPAGSPAHTPPHSPYDSPPRTPPLDVDQGRRATRPRQLGSTSRAPSQVPPPPSPRASGFLETEGYNDRHSRRPAPRSRATSPMPPLNPARPQIDIRSPSPAMHQKCFSNATAESTYLKSRPLSFASGEVSQPSSLKPPGVGQRRRASSSSDIRPQLSVNPVGMASLEPGGFPASPRSPSRPTMSGRAVSMGAVPISLPPCPRPNSVIGYDDWYTLSGGPSSFSICPSCQDTFLSAGHGRHLKPKSRHAAEQPLRCDMSSPWMRMAYTSLLKKRRPDIDPIYTLAEILSDEAPCPGKIPSKRSWYRLKDPTNNLSIHDFQICHSCLLLLETGLPSLRGTFHLSRSSRSEARICSLRADSKRFLTYLEVLESTARQADEYKRPPHTSQIIDLAKRYADLQECTRDDMLRGQEWYFIPSLREFTVCEDCYEEVVWPAIKANLPVATDFKRKAEAVAHDHVGVSCQLYSPRMRKIFHDACQRGHMELLVNAALQRYDVEQELQARNLEVQRSWPREEWAREVARLAEEWRRWE